MTEGGLKAMTRAKALKVGHFVCEFATPGIGHILKGAGCDYVLLDMEHSGFSHETVKSLIRYFQAAGLPAIVRPPSKDYHHVARLADMGAEGFLLPMVGTVADAEAAVRAIKYFPDGARGVALGIAHDDYRGGPVAEKLAAANRRTTVIALIETAEAIDNIDAIAAVEGVDCLWLGHFDLSASLGLPGAFDHPDFIAAVDRLRAAARRHDRALGKMVATPEEGVAVYADGFDFVCYSGDVWLMQSALAAGVAAIRAGVAKRPAQTAKGSTAKPSAAKGTAAKASAAKTSSTGTPAAKVSSTKAGPATASPAKTPPTKSKRAAKGSAAAPKPATAEAATGATTPSAEPAERPKRRARGKA